MKKCLFSFILFLSFLNFYGQCPTGDITLSSQLDIDNFSINYPGCTDLPGDLILTPYGIYNLNGLSAITSIQGDLKLENTRLTLLDGLDNLSTIGGDLYITSSRITSLSALSSLTSIGGSLTISCSGLPDVTGLENLTSIGSDLVISRVMNNLNGLSGITQIAGDVWFTYQSTLQGLENLQTINGNLTVQNCGLLNFQGLNGLESIGGEVLIKSNSSLESLEGLSSLQTIGGKLTVNAVQTSLSTLNGLDALTSIGGDLSAFGDNLESFEGLENLQIIDGDLIIAAIYITNTKGHKTTNGLNSLTTINGDIKADDSILEDLSIPNLTTLSGELLLENNEKLISINFPSIKTIGAGFGISDNINLATISGFSDLESITNNFIIHNNRKLIFISSFDSLTNVGQDFIIDGLLELPQIDGFNSLKTVPGNFHLTDLYKVENISGFSNLEITGEFKILNGRFIESIPSFNKLKTTSGDFEIYRCYGLLNINGFNDLSQINGHLQIKENLELQSISGFASLDSTKGFYVESNPKMLSVSGLNALRVIDGGLTFSNHQKLESVPDFHLVETVSDAIRFSGNYALTSLNGFGLVTSLKTISFSSNPVLTELPYFNSLTTIEDSFWISDCDIIEHLDSFSNLTSVGGDFYIRGHSLLTDIEGLNNLQTIGGYLNIGGFMSTGFDSLQSVQENFHLGLTTDFDGFDVLNYVGSDIYLGGPNFKSFQWPTNLTEVNGNLAIFRTAFTDLPGIEVLESIDGYLSIKLCSQLDNITIDNVTAIGNYVELSQKGTISLNSLETVGGHLEVGGIEAINLPNLTSVGSNIELNLGNYYGVIGDLTMGSIIFIGTDLDISGYFKLTSEWGNLTQINGNFEFHNGYSHENMNSFKNLEEITGDFSFRSDAQSLQGLNKLTSIGGTLTLARGFTPQDQDAPTFQNLVGLEGLEYVGGNLRIHSNKKLTDLMGLENLAEINGALSIKWNEELIRIQALENLDASKITTLEISSNPKLSACAITAVCEFLPTLGNTYVHGNSISGNSTGCNSKEDVLENCANNTNILTGQVNLNLNNDNCSIPATPIKGIRVNATNGTNAYSSFTNEDGIYNLAVPAGSYTINVETGEIINSVAPTNSSANLVGNGDAASSDFCISIGGNVTDARVTIVPSTESVPNKRGFYYVVYENQGTTTINGTLDIYMGPNARWFSTNSQIDARITGNGIANPHTYTIVDLKPFEKRFIRLEPSSNSIDNVIVGDEITYRAEITTNSSDSNPDNNVFLLTQTATNFTPPYDELVLEGPQITLSQADEYLNYVVRFQNFEDSTVNDVLISTILDDKLDWSTFEIVSSRHVQTTSIANGNVVEFFFDNISLPAQKTSDYLSRGFIAYRIKPKQNVQVGDIISANSTIIFDGTINQQTNTVSTIIEMDIDSDGDGVVATEDPDDSDPCYPIQPRGYNGHVVTNPVWAAGDCDSDGISNALEVTNGTDPYHNDQSDGDILPPDSYAEQTIEYLGDARGLAIYENTIAVAKLSVPGKVYILQKSTNGTWIEEQNFSGSGASNYFGSSIAIHGNTMVVGDRLNTENGRNSGAIYIFEKSIDGTWQEKQKILASDGSDNDNFGGSVGIYNGIIVAGASGDDNSTGAAYLYQPLNDTWSEVRKLTASDKIIRGYFGKSVAISQNQIVIGSPGRDSDSAYIFAQQHNGMWQEIQKLTPTEGQLDNDFGHSVSIQGSNIIIGANGEGIDVLGTPGRVHLFKQMENGLWVESQKLMASNSAQYDYFGEVVSMTENRIVVSTDEDQGGPRGAAHVFHKNSNNHWYESHKFTNGDVEVFGKPSATWGNVIVVASFNKLHIFEPTEPADNDGDGVSNTQETIDGTDQNNPCDLMIINQDTYPTIDWETNDCDQDGLSNGVEISSGTNPLRADTDGDGIDDSTDTSPLDPCLPAQNAGYDQYDVTNELWASRDCDNDGVSNGDEDTNQTDPYESDFDLAITVAIENISCHGSSDASLTCQVIGGVAPYNFELYTNGTLLVGQTENVFDNLSSGPYQIKVTDSNLGEIMSSIIEVFEPEALQASSQINYQNCLGIATIEVIGGTAPYEYQINGAAFSTSNIFEELAVGNYIIGVRDANSCFTTQEIIIESSNDCSDFTLPANNFTIETTGESCASSNNGNILLRAEENLDYTATLVGGTIADSKEFRTFTNFADLEAGAYDLCVTVEGENDYQKCFSIQISEPDGLEVDSKIDDSGKTVSLSLKGSTKYFINVNGTEYSTSEDQITLPLSKVENSITVKTGKECQGVYEETLLATYDSISIFPNPVEKGDVSILLPSNNIDNEVLLTLFSQNGTRVLEKMEKPEGRTVKINMDGLPPGIYTIVITSESQNNMRKIIKK